jgi:hypothetical protein
LWAWSPRTKVLLAFGAVATARSVGAVWLPRIGDEPTRQHLESVIVASAVLVVAAAGVARRRLADGRTPAPRHAPSAPPARAPEERGV